MLEQNSNYLIWIISLPLLGALINGLLGRRLPKIAVYVIACASVLVAFILSLQAFVDLNLLVPEQRRLVQIAFSWIELKGLSLPFKLVTDPLSVLLLLVITGVGFLIHLYSTAYMAHDQSAWRYFTYLNLFVASMLVLVLGGSLPLMFIGWEGVGLCSYLLIGFWFKDTNNAKAGRKAFLVNRIGDVGFILGAFLIYTVVGTFDFAEITNTLSRFTTDPTQGLATAAALLLFVGAMGKSAQIPLYVWLPDAMAGPTPVSALIHAATMVTAGVYMVVRLSALYVLAPTAMAVIAFVGAATALFAALIALVQTDIKKVLAYSTVSQLGYMFIAVGVGAFTAGIFHLLTHAFFKALLFLGSGSVIHAMEHAHGANDPQDIRTMGGLRKHLPITTITFVIGLLAIAGIPGLSGFFSKDEILWRALSSPAGNPLLWGLGSVSALLTAFYMTRLVLLTFYGKYRGATGTQEHLHESAWQMTLPLIVLALFSTIAGYIGLPHIFAEHHYLHGWLLPVIGATELPSAHHVELFGAHVGEWTTVIISVALAVIGMGVAFLFYQIKPAMAGNLARRLPIFYKLLQHKFYVDEIYQWLIVKPLHFISFNLLFWVIDRRIIDFTVETSAQIVRGCAGLIRTLQNGNVATYLFYFAAGSIAFILMLVQL